MSMILSQADQLLATGRQTEAIALVRGAARRDDSAALVQMAIWQMAGTLLPRDLSAARTTLERAGKAGDAWAARTHANLIANGTGGDRDWAAACALLRRAAPADPIAAEQLALLEAMAITPQGTPRRVPESRLIGHGPDVLLFPGFLTPAECQHVAMVARELMEPSTIVDPVTRQRRPHPIRTSSGATLGPTQETMPIQAIQRRIAAAAGIAVENGESLSVLHYAPGEQYRLHLDALPEPCNQRIATMILFLNEGYGGGETYFEANDLKVRGRAGDAILFRNILPDGRPDPVSRHAGLPVIQGAKWVATRWLRAGPYDPWNPI